MEVSNTTYTFGTFSTPETKDDSGKQCHRVSIAATPKMPEHTVSPEIGTSVHYSETSSLTTSDHDNLDRWRLRYTNLPNPGPKAFPLAESLDTHYSSTYSPTYFSTYCPTYCSTYSPTYSSTYSPTYSSTFTDIVPQPARYTPHRLSSEGDEFKTHTALAPVPSSLGNQSSWLSDRAKVQPSEAGGRGLWAEPGTPAGESSGEAGIQRESESERREERSSYSSSDVHGLSDIISSSSGSHSSSSSASLLPTADQQDRYSVDVDVDVDGGPSGVFKATRVELTPSSPTTLSSSSSSFSSSFSSTSLSTTTTTTSSSTPVSPQEPVSPHLETLKDTLKSMEKPARTRGSRLSGAPSLPPIKEDIPDSPAKEPSALTTKQVPSALTTTKHTDTQDLLHHQMLNSSILNGNGPVSLPANLGLNWNTTKDMRSPLTLMKLQQQQQQIGLGAPLRASTMNSIVMRGSSFGEEDQVNQLNQLNGNGAGLAGPSRLDNSLIFAGGGYQQLQSMDDGLGGSQVVHHRSLFRTGSLPETGSLGAHDRISSAPMGVAAMQGMQGMQLGNGNYNLQGNLNASRIERLSFLASPAGSTTQDGSVGRISMPPSSLQLSPLSELHLGMGGQMDSMQQHHHRSFQRSFSSEGTLGLLDSPGSSVGSSYLYDGSNGGGGQVNQEPEPFKAPVPKYRAFPDAYLTKEKEHGKLNPRPGKMIIFDEPGMKGQRIEVRGDVVDATPWDFPESISIRVIRGGWVLYEKPNFKGEKVALDEGDIETLSHPFDTPDEAHQHNGQKENGESNQEPKKFVIGSIRRAVRDYSVPEISLFPEENAEGKKVVFRDTSEDARIFGFPIKANSIIINAGLWLVYAEPFFQGIPRVLEVGGFTNPAAWGVTQPYVGSLHPLKIGEPRVENPNDPKLILYDKPYFTGRSREIYTSMRDFMTRVDRQQTAFMYNAGSIKVIGGCWVGYEKEGFRGKQYLLEEGEYQDWRVWGGCDSELRSVRIIRADLTDPTLVMYELPDEELEEPQEERTFEVTEAIPDVELFGFRSTTRSIHVVSGAWVAYSHVDFSGNQFILEKGFYNNCGDWGSGDNRICSLQPILMAATDGPSYRNEVMLYSETDFQGVCKLCSANEESLPESFIAKSCRVVGSSWVLYEGRNYSGNLYAVSEGDYPNLNSMGCPPHCVICSIKAIPVMFSIPSISLFGLECFEGREIAVDTEVLNLLEAGFNNHVLSVRVNSGCWVVCEHSNYRGRQFLLEPIEVTNWQKFSDLTTIGSMYPIREKRRFFRIKNKERGHYLSVQGGVEDMKSGRVVVTEKVESMSDIWYYQDGLLKNKLAPSMTLQVMGSVEQGAKVVLWSETRMPIQTWSVTPSGTIVSGTFPGMVLDVKCGKVYDRDHVVIREESDEQPCQHWELELL
ncbi:hypothetical protein ACEWY4_024005 [Coilia grayii]|uniref:Beta/gamma crystallin 'Greek key' domain-containing protein n=1 Tax=Coilia grayii TaxID=363190 RepID=A0ABD1IZ38_9TELE